MDVRQSLDRKIKLTPQQGTRGYSNFKEYPTNRDKKHPSASGWLAYKFGIKEISPNIRRPTFENTRIAVKEEKDI